jgi:hypothetical protein
MYIDINFFKNIYNDDIIYHYTKASIAIDYILYKNKLQFSPARNSIDPIESTKAERGTIYYGLEVDILTSKQQSIDENELHVFVNDMEEQFNQICFCQNSMGEDFASKNFISNFKGHEELFGFTKLRMWDQYADKFSGVCIAFSKEKILSLNKELFDIVEGNVQYLTFQELSLKKTGDIQGNHLLKVGKVKYKDQLEQSVKESFFYKHIDYSGETEYRIGTLFDKDKCTIETIRGELIFDKTMMLDISGCIEAIFVSCYANKKQKNDLLDYADKLNVKIIEMQWKFNSFEVNDYKEWIKYLKEAEQFINKS